MSVAHDDRADPAEAAWSLEDGEAVHAAHPRSFFIPPREHRTDIRADESCAVSVAFAERVVDGEPRRTETVWVGVVDVLPGGRYRGRIDERPAFVEGLGVGDLIEFEPRHVVAIAYSPDELGYDPGDWAVIDARIMAEDSPPLALTFAEPNGMDERYWFAALDQQPPDDSQWAQLGELTDRWPELATVFAAGGGMWRRAKASGAYEQV